MKPIHAWEIKYLHPQDDVSFTLPDKGSKDKEGLNMEEADSSGEDNEYMREARVVFDTRVCVGIVRRGLNFTSPVGIFTHINPHSLSTFHRYHSSASPVLLRRKSMCYMRCLYSPVV